jgi:hypothetical protein
MCSCQCKMCRVPGSSHCRAHPGCNVSNATGRAFAARDERAVAGVLRELKTASGSHSPSVIEVERALPGLVGVDACFLSNPYATNVVMSRLRALDPSRLERMVSHYPSRGLRLRRCSQSSLAVPAEKVCVGNGACELIHALLAAARGPLLWPANRRDGRPSAVRLDPPPGSCVHPHPDYSRRTTNTRRCGPQQ